MFNFLRAWLLFTWGGLHRYFGNANTMPSEHERAIHYFDRAFAVDPTFWMARVHKGVLLSREFGKHEEALAEFDAVLAAEPSNAEALFNRGMTLQANGRFPEALTDLQTYLPLAETAQRHSETERLIQALQSIIDDLTPDT